MGVVESWVGQALSKCNIADCLFDRWEAGNGLIGILAEWKQVAQMCIQIQIQMQIQMQMIIQILWEAGVGLIGILAEWKPERDMLHKNWKCILGSNTGF